MQTEKYLKSIRTAGHCCEDVVGVHGAEDEVGAVPRFEAVATKNAAAGPTLKTRHAHGRQVARFTLVLHLKIITNGSKKRKFVIGSLNWSKKWPIKLEMLHCKRCRKQLLLITVALEISERFCNFTSYCFKYGN